MTGHELNKCEDRSVGASSLQIEFADLPTVEESGGEAQGEIVVPRSLRGKENPKCGYN